LATFEAQVEGLTGINIDSSTNPTQTQLTQFLRDGVIDVINRITRIKESAERYQAKRNEANGITTETTTESTSSNGDDMPW